MEPSNRLKQAAELFHAALERASNQRKAFLIDACATDSDLLKEVQSLLSAHEQLSSFLNAPEVVAMRTDISKPTSQFEINQLIDHYRIISLLGRGGMSEVYLAQDTKLHRRVALKLLRANLTRDKQRLKRFQQEACAASALSHPNILTIHDSGQQGDLHFIVTEYIEGKTLRQMLIQGKLTLGHALDVAVQVSGALAAAFAAGIIHRDIKPENIIVRPDGYVKVLDFGLAKLTGREDALPWLSSFSILDTSPGMVMGTVNYMSPEQARGLPVDGGSDIFSLGVVLYEMLTGQPPFDGETPSDVIASILEKEPLPLILYWPEVPLELQRIVSKTLQKERDERYQFIKDLHLELKNLKRDLEFDARLQHELVPQTSNEVIAGWRSKQSLGAVVNRPGSAISVNLWLCWFCFSPSVRYSTFRYAPDRAVKQILRRAAQTLQR
jgi:serine/threonine protein kinase